MILNKIITQADSYAQSTTTAQRIERREKLIRLLKNTIPYEEIENLCNYEGCYRKRAAKGSIKTLCEKHRREYSAKIVRKSLALKEPQNHFECLDCGDFMGVFKNGNYKRANRMIDRCKHCGSKNIDDVIR